MKPVYFLCGEETFYVDALQDEIIALMPPDMRDFNMDILYGTEHSLDKALGVAKSYPMMSDRRIVVLREFWSVFDKRKQVLADPDEREENEPDIPSSEMMEMLENYVARPSTSTIMVFTDKKGVGGNTRLGKLVTNSEHALSATFDPIPEDALPGWIIDWAQVNYEKEIRPDAAQEMARLTGSDLLLVSTEIDKLCTFKNTGEAVTAADVKKMVTVAREYSVFELKDALFSRKTGETLRIAEQILYTSKTTDAGEVIRIVSFFYSVFMNIWQIQRLTQKGIPSAEIKKTIGVSSDYYFRNLVRESRVFPPERMPQIFEALLDADRAVKGMSKLEAKDIFFIMLRRIIG